MTPAPSTASRLAARDLALLRASLAAVWLGTAVVSVLEAHGRSAALLAATGVRSPALLALMLWGGAALDAAIGLLLAFAPPRLAATCALAGALAMTIVTTALLPALWLDPIGPLLKNLPILAALVVLRRQAQESS